MEGESLFNDGMAVVAFGFLAALSMGTAEWRFKPILVQFFTVVNLGFGLRNLYNYRRFGWFWSDWSCD
ncbi:sodium/hydrogen exchanger [Calothrix sp. NIES-4071]|nr:sodium/hydrogen exchanger [Calothrix sp. NIES-4071]BAZ55201.1 sodium/hydrogen exchanger [Calothrix sp. NIES-4105]